MLSQLNNVESEILRLFGKGNMDATATYALECYGPEVLGFLVATLRNEPDAEDVFSQLCEDAWRGIGKFGWRCSFRTWLYTLARHATARYLRSPHRKRGRLIPLSAAAEVAKSVRLSTVAHLRTEVKDSFSRLRDKLDPEDQALLILRVDRNLSWNDIARVMVEDAELDAEDLARISARQRKRFQTIKETLRRYAMEEGLLSHGH